MILPFLINWRFMERSIGLKQIRHKLYCAFKIVRHELSWITITNLLLVLMIDAFFGTLVSSYLRGFPNLYSLILGRVEALLQVLLQLITWLGGSPAGLKLNAALNSLMGRFFSYHLHLWRNYIGILEPLLSFILSTLINVGFCGLTLQIALAKDLLSIATFHIYCLYIYATRLFNVELNLLKSLGRLFFGRKWNPLRNRIDSIHLSNSEMFLSSMGFTISVFLAPTTIPYYIVFLSLRLPCLIVESILSYLVEVVNSMEPITCFLILTNSSWVADKIYIKPVKLCDPTTEIQSYEIHTRTSLKLFKTPNLGKPIMDVICKIFQSKVITQ